MRECFKAGLEIALSCSQDCCHWYSRARKGKEGRGGDGLKKGMSWDSFMAAMRKMELRRLWDGGE
jgi:hypothetical protein